GTSKTVLGIAQAVSELGEVALEVGEIEHRRVLNVGSTVSAQVRLPWNAASRIQKPGGDAR
ncbi:MAG: hypothetical protein ACO23P_07350, partial [Vulcanococcus sp.]